MYYMPHSTVRVNLRVEQEHINELEKIYKRIDRDRGEMFELHIKEIGWMIRMDYKGLQLLLSCAEEE